LYIRDDVTDMGVEPNTSGAPMWTSPDIWVQTAPLQGWSPRPYQTATPPAWVPDATQAINPAHQNPDYRSPLSGNPNYVYVRIRNKGSASTGTERLLVYWASASTGLSWDPTKVGGAFIDNVQNGVLFGSEITKPRKNAAAATQAERDAFVAALKKIATDPAFSWANLLGGMSYWHTQQEIHRFGPLNRHGFPNNNNTAWIPSIVFLPWHREFINRLEGLLQEADPKVKLLYWQWTNKPVPPFASPNGVAPFLDYSNNFMGAFGAGAAAAVPMGAPLSPDLDPAYLIDTQVKTANRGVVTRRLQPPSPFNPLAQTDNTVLARTPYDTAGSANSAFSGGLESFSHNSSHVYIASITNNNATISGDQLFQNYAGRDPFFYLLHAKVDELWARWQRQSLNNLDPASTYDTVNVPMSTLATNMGPWDGTLPGTDGLTPSQSNLHPSNRMEPWGLLGGQAFAKNGADRSVTSPPIYDTALLTIPVLQPGEEVIMEIPWFPPNPSGFGNIADPHHVCLIARIETSTSSPYGMTVAETTDINFNTQQNNNIAWRNVTVVDTFPGPFKMVKFLLANGFKEPVKAGLRFGAKLNQPGADFFDRGAVRVELGRELTARWRAAGANARGIEAVGDDQLRITRADTVLDGIELKPGEQFPVRLTFDLKRDYAPTKKGEHIIYDVVQVGTPRDPNAVVGGQRFQVAVNQLTPIEKGRIWRWLPGTQRVSDKWREVDFDDSDWFKRKLDLGWVEPDVKAAHGAVTPASYYFRYDFDVEDPGFFRNLLMRIKRSDGAVVYLNGKEVYRSNLPDGNLTARTLAAAPAARIERDIYFPVKLDPSALRKGRNVIAVQIHRSERTRGALAFDLELNANVETAQQAPFVKFANVLDGQLLTAGTTATIDVDAVKLDGLIRSATLLVDEKPVQTLERPPFSFKWQVQPGIHRLTVVVTDNDGMRSNAYNTITGVRNVPPVVAIIQPGEHSEIVQGDVLAVVARAEDPDGKIAKVEFFIHDSYIIGSPGRSAGTVTKPPYTVTIGNLKVGHAMIAAVATDEGGARTASAPVMVIVSEKGADHSGHR
jgi:hypothetical protein